MPSLPKNLEDPQIVLDLTYAIMTLSQTLETMHEDLRGLHNESSRINEQRYEKLRDLIQQNSLTLSHLPVDTADRTDQVVSKQVHSILDETRRAVDEVRMKLWMAVGTPRGPEASGSGMTIKDGVPVPLTKESGVAGQVTLLDDGKMKVEGKFDAAKIAKFWTVAKWTIAGLAAAGGVAGIVKAIMAIFHNL
jgi:hypothetical protein